MDKSGSRTRIINVLLIFFVCLLSIGTVGFYFLKDLSPWEAFYQSLIILTTHFYHQINEDFWVQILILLLILGSFIIVAYIVKFFAEYLFEGTFKESRRRRYMKKLIDNYEGHYIVCGFGRVGKQVAEELSDEKVKFITLDKDPKEYKEAVDRGFPAILGDPTEEEMLMKSGILKAKCLIACAVVI
jgi:voltage-gated potassium channel